MHYYVCMEVEVPFQTPKQADVEVAEPQYFFLCATIGSTPLSEGSVHLFEQ
jgi:hypothetical protein